MLLLGIDEAGYGPLLGPLVVGGVLLRMPNESAPPDLWQRLSRSVSRAPAPRDPRLAIADSKKLFHQKSGLDRLERAALVMLAVAGQHPRSLRELLSIVSAQSGESLDTYPWYKGYDLPLPAGVSEDAVAVQANAVRNDMSSTGVEVVNVAVEPLPEGHFNRQVSTLRNKAAVLSGLALRIAHRAVASRRGEPLWICVDRQGGRCRYAEQLMTFFEPKSLSILEESDSRSAYQIRDSAGPWRIEFAVNAETRHLPVALASIYCKYVRELLMRGLNAYFSERVGGLRATAGYYVDAQRFLRDIGPAIQSERLDLDMLVRVR